MAVIALAWSDAMNAATFATSASVGSRRRSVLPSRRSWNSFRSANCFDSSGYSRQLSESFGPEANDSNAARSELARQIHRERLDGRTCDAEAPHQRGPHHRVGNPDSRGREREDRARSSLECRAAALAVRRWVVVPTMIGRL